VLQLAQPAQLVTCALATHIAIRTVSICPRMRTAADLAIGANVLSIGLALAFFPPATYAERIAAGSNLVNLQETN